MPVGYPPFFPFGGLTSPPAAPAMATSFAPGVTLFDLSVLWPATDVADWCGEHAAREGPG